MCLLACILQQAMPNGVSEKRNSLEITGRCTMRISRKLTIRLLMAAVPGLFLVSPAAALLRAGAKVNSRGKEKS